jgi:hypothetical protein
MEALFEWHFKQVCYCKLLTLTMTRLRDKFRYLRTNTIVYLNNTVDINALVAASSVGTILPAVVHTTTADVPAGTTGDNYSVLSLGLAETHTKFHLCWSADPLDVDYVCCDCDPCSEPMSRVVIAKRRCWAQQQFSTLTVKRVLLLGHNNT